MMLYIYIAYIYDIMYIYIYIYIYIHIYIIIIIIIIFHCVSGYRMQFFFINIGQCCKAFVQCKTSLSPVLVKFILESVQQYILY